MKRFAVRLLIGICAQCNEPHSHQFRAPACATPRPVKPQKESALAAAYP